MATTYTVTTSFSADTTAVASEVNQNFTDVLTALNAFDATNLTGTIALARISNLTSSQMASTYFKDEDNMASDSATAVSSQQAIKAYVGTQIDALATSAYTNLDSESNAMLKAHAYKAITDGSVCVKSSLTAQESMTGYVGTTSDPEGAGDSIQVISNGVLGSVTMSFSFDVAKDEYFEIVLSSTSTPTIRWKSYGTLSKPVDNN